MSAGIRSPRQNDAHRFRVLTGVFFATAYATILTPGPNMMYVGTAGAQRGPGVGAIAALGAVLGGICYTLTTAIGVSAAMAAHPGLLTVIRAAGMVYLVYLGIRLLLRARDATLPPPVSDAGSRSFRSALLISLTNPQLALFFLAFLPQFVVVGGQPVWLQLLELGLVFNCCSLSMLLTVGTLSGMAGHQVTSVRFRQAMRAVAGVAFILLAVRTGLALLR